MANMTEAEITNVYGLPPKDDQETIVILAENAINTIREIRDFLCSSDDACVNLAKAALNDIVDFSKTGNHIGSE